MKKSNPPDTIYLQWYVMDWEEGEAYHDPSIEATWSADEINDSDTKYLRAIPEREWAEQLYYTVVRLINMRATMAPEMQAIVVAGARDLLAEIEEEE